MNSQGKEVPTEDDRSPSVESFWNSYTTASDRDPGSPSRTGRLTTSLDSTWLYHRCPSCRHTFRVGDTVILGEDGAVRHDGDRACQGPDPQNAFGDAVLQFFEGLDRACPPPRGIRVVRLEAGHRLLSEEKGAFRRHGCAVCGHSFRAGDQVVICPCSPDSPRCMIAVHRDSVHGLYCWDDWSAAKRDMLCPMNGRRM
ncbi:MAG: hypothetical protein AAF196_04485 [Planctomycetota bacterium]